MIIVRNDETGSSSEKVVACRALFIIATVRKHRGKVVTDYLSLLVGKNGVVVCAIQTVGKATFKGGHGT